MNCNSGTYSLNLLNDTSSCPFECGNLNILINCKDIMINENQRNLAVMGENGTRIITFDIPRFINEKDLSKMTLNINLLNNNDEKYTIKLEYTNEDIKENYINAHWNIDTTVTSVAGKLLVEIEAIDTNFDWKTYQNYFIINESLN